jgi:hypothetical protein
MKFIVDEMPFWETDCPFYADGGCACDGRECLYMTLNSAGHRDPEDCRWLVVKEDAK